jgi:hypothetical protein
MRRLRQPDQDWFSETEMMRQPMGTGFRSSRAAFFAFALLPLSLVLHGCGAYGAGFRELAWADGWQRLPIGRWLLNDDIQPKALVICPREICPQMAVVALFEAEGRAAAELERALASDTLLSARKKPSQARGQTRTIGGQPAKTAAKKPDVTATTHIERFMVDGMAATRVAMTPQPAKPGSAAQPALAGNSAYAVVLTQRFGTRLKAVMAVTTSPDTALTQAQAAAKDW